MNSPARTLVLMDNATIRKLNHGESRASSRLLGLRIHATGIWKHCPRRVYSRARETLEVVLARRLHLGWR
jgi:hypothetical protein